MNTEPDMKTGMADAKALQTIEEEVRVAVAGGGDAAVALARLLDAIERGALPDRDARRQIDALALRLHANYHINGPKGVIVFRPVEAR